MGVGVGVGGGGGGVGGGGGGGGEEESGVLLNLGVLKFSMLYKSHIFQCMGQKFCVELQRVPLKFHTNSTPF